MTPAELDNYSNSFIMELENIHKSNESQIKIEDNEPKISQVFKDLTSNYVSSINDQFPGQAHLYFTNYRYRNDINETIFQHVYKENLDTRPIIENSLEHLNYSMFEKIAKPILDNDAFYIKFASVGMQDLIIEKIDNNRIAMAHYFELNGDLMSDPDVEVVLDTKNELFIPKTYQLDSLQVYQDEHSNPNITKELNVFMKTWLQNIEKQQYRIKTLLGDEIEFNDKKKFNELQKYCKEKGLTHLAPNRKELER